MPLDGPFEQLRRLRRNVVELANAGGRPQRDLATAVSREIKGVIREQFTRGEGPDGPHPRRVDGKPALVSKKLPGDFEARVLPGGVLWVRPSRAPWLRAHHEGHVFPPRRAGGQVLTFDKNGRLLRQSRIKKQRFVFDRVARAHAIRARVLKRRPIYPDPNRPFPSKWAVRINAASSMVMARWHRNATR
jgi:hypothetical protein